MDNVTHFESRSGSLSGTPEEVFEFVTDIRNFRQFVPDGTINNWQSEKDACSFNVSMVGTINVRIKDKEPFNKVVYNGDALNKNDFSLFLDISNGSENNAVVRLSLEAELNPMLKMVASKPLVQFLELLVREMENFTGWNNRSGRE